APRLTLSPSTTLFRSPAPCFHGARTFLPGGLSALAGAAVRPAGGRNVATGPPAVNRDLGKRCGEPSIARHHRLGATAILARPVRSEEHTSELQSRENL